MPGVHVDPDEVLDQRGPQERLQDVAIYLRGRSRLHDVISFSLEDCSSRDSEKALKTGAISLPSSRISPISRASVSLSTSRNRDSVMPVSIGAGYFRICATISMAILI